MEKTSAYPEGARLAAPREVRTMVGGLSESTIRRLVAEGTFPKPIVLGRNRHGKPVRIAFIESEVVEWVKTRIAADRRGEAA